MISLSVFLVKILVAMTKLGITGFKWELIFAKHGWKL